MNTSLLQQLTSFMKGLQTGDRDVLVSNLETKRAQKASREAKPDRDFEANPKDWNEERYSVTQWQLHVVAYLSEKVGFCEEIPDLKTTSTLSSHIIQPRQRWIFESHR